MIDFRIEHDTSEITGLTKRKIGNAIKRAHYNTGRRHYRRHVPLHFTNKAMSLYDEYEPRKGERGSGVRFRGSYTERKLKKHNHTRPLEFSGRLKEETLEKERIKATRNRIVITFSSGFNRRHPKSRVDMVREIRAVNSRELKDLAEYLVLNIEAQVVFEGGSGAALSTLQVA